MKRYLEFLPSMMVAAAAIVTTMQSALAGGGGIDDGGNNVVAVPEPATALVLAAGAVGLYAIRKFRSRDTEE